MNTILNRFTAVAAALVMFSPAALAALESQISASGIGCGEDYLGNSFTCTAGDIAISSVVDIQFEGDPEGCVIGEPITIESATVVYDISTGERYDLTLWIGDQQGTDPRGSAGTNESCSAFSVPGPFNPQPDAVNPWGNAEPLLVADTCGDLAFGVDGSERVFTNIETTCQDNDGNGFADLQVLLTWDNTKATAACNAGNFPTDGGTRSKCDYGVTTNDTLPIIPPPTLEMVKTVTNDSGGNDVASSFNLTLTGADGTHDSGVDYQDGDTPTIVDGVEYSVSETPNTGYTLDSITCVDTETQLEVGDESTPFTAENGQAIVCTFVNLDEAPTLTVVKNVVNDEEPPGTATADQFTLHVTGAGGLCGQDGTADITGSATGVPVAPVDSNCAYTVSEDPPIAGYANLGVVCFDDDTAVAVPHPVILNEGQAVTCTLTNNDIPVSTAGTITLVKQVSGGLAGPGDFTLHLTGDNGDAGNCGQDGTANYLSGYTDTAPQDACAYTVSEDAFAGYTQGGIVCVDAAQVDVGNPFTFAAGQNITCTVTNDVAITQLALTKDVTNDNGGAAVATDWTLSADNGPSSPISGAGGFLLTTVEPGIYLLNETGPTGYTPGVWACVDDAAAAFPINGNELTLAAGDVVTCTITNNDNAVATNFRVTKEFTDGNPSEVEVTLNCFTGLPLTQSQNISQSHDVVFIIESFAPGELNCDVSENVPEGYSPTYYADVDSESDTPGVAGSITNDAEGCHYEGVDSGAFLCAIVNSPDPVDVIVEKDWVIEGSGGDQVSQIFELTMFCDAEIVDGSNECGGPDLVKGVVGYDWCKSFAGNGDNTFTAQVIPEYLFSRCYVEEYVYDDAAEVDNGCGNLVVRAGQGDSCLITNTVFFEGIPTLSQYGKLLFIMLMLGVGFVAYRRFI